ncbi:methyltransferase domain-containing protein [Paenibacillus xerothermodurans]|uniref:Methyltransferase domain-containing protein n=1 Tax=Paenibacillus xerothermodurans TaxID=1977292 RepID=A0A2W1NV42_PAEXE|nr:methyltransferase domain-containing protein [Paenibacillus xerothermodurans]PZE19552.1 methyltransferase domain-containing protein [Paenibacillus xerothermodurans]
MERKIPDLSRRASAAELMDDFSQGGSELREALSHLRRLNRIFSAAGPCLYGLKRLWRYAGKPQKLTILDVGAGSGDVNRRILRWGSSRGVNLSITLVDLTEESCEEARLLFRREPRVQVEQRSVYDLPGNCADIVTGSQFLHHFDENELPGVTASMLKAARLGVVVSDIHRHWLAWTAVWLATRAVSANRYIRHDGPLSVAKGFRAEDWNRLRDDLGTTGLSYSWRPMFRYAVVIPKDVT